MPNRHQPKKATNRTNRSPKPTSKPAPRVPANRGRRLPPEPLTPDEVQALLRACSPRAITGIRNRALLVLLWRGGLRVSEALALKPVDIDVTTGELRVLHGKGDRSRVVALDAEALAVVQRWLDKRHALGINGKATVICTLAGKPVLPSYVRGLMPRLAQRAGIEKRCHAHGLRHTLAFELAREGVSVPVISRVLGHSTVATTAVYLQHVTNAEAVDAMKARSWAKAGKRMGEGDTESKGK